jgi:hypothetical protein
VVSRLRDENGRVMFKTEILRVTDWFTNKYRPFRLQFNEFSIESGAYNFCRS